MDALTCRAPARCRSCEWLLPSGACKLEAAIVESTSVRAPSSSVLLLVDRRALA